MKFFVKRELIVLDTTTCLQIVDRSQSHQKARFVYLCDAAGTVKQLAMALDARHGNANNGWSFNSIPFYFRSDQQPGGDLDQFFHVKFVLFLNMQLH